MSADAQEKRKRRQKLNPKAWIGYLVGYNSTNIYRVWNPLTNEVIAVRDVAFNEAEFFSGDITDLKDDLLRVTEEELRAMLETVRLQEPPNPEPGATTQEEDEELSGIIQEHLGEGERHQGGFGEELAQDGVDGNVCTGGTDHPYSTARFEPLLTPESSPPPVAALLATAFRGLTERKESAEIARCRQEEDARLLLVPPGDNRAIRRRYGVWEAAFNAGRLATPVGTYNGERVTKRQLHKIELDKHPMAVGFREAEKAHLQSHRERQSWTEVDKEKSAGHQLLGCMWVYVYKFDKHGWFIKCKARLVVRGDQQAKTVLEDTYASTLAGRSFRTLIAIAARFDLELIQYDVVNAFVHAKLPYDVFMRMPPGYRTRGKVLHLHKALYGLRESPLLWQRHFTQTLTRMGFTPVPHEPCCFGKQGVLIFFYVDDIVVAYRKTAQETVNATVRELERTYTLQGGHDLQWFLGVEVIRDRQRRLIWLSQSDSLNKLTRLVGQSDTKCPETPMKQKELLPFDGRASPSSINKY
ncbi:putative retrotransposon HobS hobase [Madurella fahalii]|uniref:Retrotransposon HobS hobase n=1 Tax=Madurella fahalii TaxID=1157608 RepID=A0ABQ0GP44_9PEZI